MKVTDENMEFADKITVPVHITAASQDKLTTVGSIRKYAERMVNAVVRI